MALAIKIVLLAVAAVITWSALAALAYRDEKVKNTDM